MEQDSDDEQLQTESKKRKRPTPQDAVSQATTSTRETRDEPAEKRQKEQPVITIISKTKIEEIADFNDADKCVSSNLKDITDIAGQNPIRINLKNGSRIYIDADVARIAGFFCSSISLMKERYEGLNFPAFSDEAVKFVCNLLHSIYNFRLDATIPEEERNAFFDEVITSQNIEDLGKCILFLQVPELEAAFIRNLDLDGIADQLIDPEFIKQFDGNFGDEFIQSACNLIFFKRELAKVMFSKVLSRYSDIIKPVYKITQTLNVHDPIHYLVFREDESNVFFSSNTEEVYRAKFMRWEFQPGGSWVGNKNLLDGYLGPDMCNGYARDAGLYFRNENFTRLEHIFLYSPFKKLDSLNRHSNRIGIYPCINGGCVYHLLSEDRKMALEYGGRSISLHYPTENNYFCRHPRLNYTFYEHGNIAVIVASHDCKMLFVGFVSDSEIEFCRYNQDFPMEVSREGLFGGNLGGVHSMVLSNDEKILVSGSCNGKIIVWIHDSRFDKWKKIQTLEQYKTYEKNNYGDVRHLILSDDGNMLIAADDKKVKIWHKTKNIQFSLVQELAIEHVSCMALSKDNSTLLVGTNDGIINILNLHANISLEEMLYFLKEGSKTWYQKTWDACMGIFGKK